MPPSTESCLAAGVAVSSAHLAHSARGTCPDQKAQGSMTSPSRRPFKSLVTVLDKGRGPLPQGRPSWCIGDLAHHWVLLLA
ncbi:hypothetical protein M440DRAFT_1400536 [Trichoderma longibrachiatum ATCC 18648]|uniref:Uncharacterized protein n=1 Tax=Trichoderma longibrachiatum ATCC 18648 TaxID=983965 RepID=A0A2T4C7Q6_TRILO|nr:hypothetical protein M440DRAFT_1400536 [Trichoderma longibrachiatum ATCC 18648]